MIIEKLVGAQNLPRYRAWKQGVRRAARNRAETLRLAWADGSLRRLGDADFEPLFICGISGSGTTLISALLDQNYDNHLALRESARHPLADNLLWLDKTEAYENLDNYLQALYGAEGVSPARVRQATLNLYRRLARYPRTSSMVLDKAPNSHLVRIGQLLEAFPNSKAVLIYRDPVEMIEGLRRKWPKPFGNAKLDVLIAFWKDMHTSFLDQTARKADRCLAYSYAHLVAAPEQVQDEIADSAGLQKRESPIALKDKANKPGKGIRNVVAGKIHIVRDAGKKSRENVSAEEATLIEEQTKPVLARLAERAVGT